MAVVMYHQNVTHRLAQADRERLSIMSPRLVGRGWHVTVSIGIRSLSAGGAEAQNHSGRGHSGAGGATKRGEPTLTADFGWRGVHGLRRSSARTTTEYEFRLPSAPRANELTPITVGGQPGATCSCTQYFSPSQQHLALFHPWTGAGSGKWS